MDTALLTQKAIAYIAAETNDYFKRQVVELLDKKDWNELNDRFFTDLTFGTGGLRGVIGGGYNRMNPFTVRRATQGLADYIKKTASAAVKNASAVIAYDSRRFSDLFSLEAALVLCGNGIKTYLYTSLRPTPQLSFSVRYLKATAGIVVTASHNPPQYNGYKAYWSDGGQVVPPHDEGIIRDVLAVQKIVVLPREEAAARGLLVMIDKELDDAYVAMVKAQALRPKLIKEKGKTLKVVYTPLHGAGAVPVERVLRELGVDVAFVEEQRKPDGDFPTVKSPNPEEASAMQLACERGRRIGADLVIGTDPDADRIGIAVPDKANYVLITGNQLGTLLADYIFSTRHELGVMPAKPAFVNTIVTTRLQCDIAASFGAQCYSVLTGFKYIAEKIRQFENERNGIEYVFGGEESYGFLVGTSVRDKDAVSAAAMTVEMALYHVSSGKTLIERLREIYLKYGYYNEGQVSQYFEGESGLARMNAIMERLRTDPPSAFNGQKVVSIKDYRDGTTFTVAGKGRKKDIDLPSSNVLQFFLRDNTIVTARPSGTEPKIKFYVSCCSKPGTPLITAEREVSEKIESVKKQIRELLV